MRRTPLLAVALAAATLGGCALFTPSDGMGSPPAPVMAPPPPPPPPAPMPAPPPPEMETGAAPDDIDRGLPICPGDPRCKKAGPG